MPLHEHLQALLPSLRRYARSLTGKQREGDQLVEDLLNQLLEDKLDLSHTASSRPAFYKALGDLVDVQIEASDILPEYLRLANTTDRRALLLTSVENFSDEEVAEALDIETDSVQDRVRNATEELLSSLATTAMVIEDEPFIAYDLATTLRGLGHTVPATANTHAQAVALAKMHKPSLILADLRLADESSGLEAVEEIQEFCNAQVVFITAYPEQLLTGDKPEPAFLIPKPFKTKTVTAVVCQALLMHQMAR
ncbi:PhyR family response regulator anti-anti-sigma factor [Hyphomonas beringensis]|uniref:PhyR family response regulator anti-anti-sigma factor n=1 Tax=Hyphomonas beringensis TaxID=1280946 RepID=UPI000557149A|nr:response regulator [Hyphomonas beringensis]